MRVEILVQSGGSHNRRIVLRSDQVAKFGRTDWADFAFPEDQALADEHFVIQCAQDSCYLRALDKTRPTIVNGTAVEQIQLQPGDMVQAGQTHFMVQFDPPALAADQAISLDSGELPPPPVDPDAAWKFAQYIELSPAGIELAKQQPIEEFGKALVGAKMRKDAVRWHAHRLPKPLAVSWAGVCIEQQPAALGDPLQKSAFEAALAWANEPTEAHRRVAAELAERAQWEGIGGVLAAAAGWSGGSLGPEDHPPVPPDERLTGRCTTISLVLLDCQGEPGRSVERYDSFLAQLPKVFVG